MRIVLVRCRAETGPKETNVTGVYPPLGLAYLAAALRAAGHDVQIVDAEASRLNGIGTVECIPPDTDIVGFTSTSLLWPSVRRVAAMAHQRYPRALLVLGGAHVTAFPQESLAASVFNIGVLGDGERTLCQLVERHAADEPFDSVPGCVVRDEDSIRLTGPIPWVEDLDALPLPALDMLPMKAYHSVMVREPFVSMVTSRGCPYRCQYCSQIYSGSRLRTRGPESIVDEMERAVKQFGAREIILFDETFGVKRREAMRVCELIRERGLKFRWNARTRIDVLDRELLTAMREAGCYALHLGVEAGTQRILDLMQKRITIEQVREAVAMARDLGFWLHAYFMIGYPGETREEITATLRFSRELDLDWASYTITIPNPRTPLFDLAVEQGCLEPDFWERYTNGETDLDIPFFVSEQCNEATLKKLKRQAYLYFYLRPRILWRNLLFFLKTGGIRRLARAFGLWVREELL